MTQWTFLPSFIDCESNRRYVREQEGYARALDMPPGGVPRASTTFFPCGVRLEDFRGAMPEGACSAPGDQQAHKDCHTVTWETSPAQSAETTVFTWIGGSQVLPEFRPAFPPVVATLFVNDVERLTFPLGRPEIYTVSGEGGTLTFEPRKFQSLAEELDPFWTPYGSSGFYRLQAPGEWLTPGQPLRLRVELTPHPGTESFFYLSPRTDALAIDLALLRDEMAAVQTDLVSLRRSHAMLYAQQYPQLFPNRIQGETVIAFQSDTRHVLPAALTVMSDGEVVITFCESAHHVDRDGRILLLRSPDGGRSWSEPEVMFALPHGDHRASPIIELPNGDWVTLDYRAAALYDARGVYNFAQNTAPTLWGAWSSDRGKSWTFTDEPLTVPGAGCPYAEIERHPIRLPSGRLLLAVDFALPEDLKTFPFAEAIFASDDDGRSWHFLAMPKPNPAVTGEGTLLWLANGDVLLLVRTEIGTGNNWRQQGMLLQSISHDEGESWSDFTPTPLASMSSPAHLLRLQDGRILCTHASRQYPASIYATISEDEGQSWQTTRTKIVTDDLIGFDACYPNSGQLPDGVILTTWYANMFGKFFVAVKRYAPEEL